MVSRLGAFWAPVECKLDPLILRLGRGIPRRLASVVETTGLKKGVVAGGLGMFWARTRLLRRMHSAVTTSVLSAADRAGLVSPALRDLLTDSTSWGTNRLRSGDKLLAKERTCLEVSIS